MPEYNVDTAFWRKGELLPVDSTVSMTEAEAKYLKHAITEKSAKAAEPATPAAEPEPAPALVAAVAVEEQSVSGHRGRRRHAENQHVDSN